MPILIDCVLIKAAPDLQSVCAFAQDIASAIDFGLAEAELFLQPSLNIRPESRPQQAIKHRGVKSSRAHDAILAADSVKFASQMSEGFVAA